VSLAYFDIKQNNVVVPNPEFQIDHTVPQFLIFDLTNDGIELEFAGLLTPSLSFIGSITSMHARNSFGRRPRAIADRAAGLLATYGFREGVPEGLSRMALR